MKKLLFYIDRRSRGGAQRVMVELANYFAAAREYEVIFATQMESPENGYALGDGVREIVLKNSATGSALGKISRMARRVKDLKELCKKENPDLVISFLIPANIVAIKACKSLGIPVLLSVRNDPERDHGKIYHALIKRYYPLASGIVFQTESARDYFDFKGETAVIMNPLSAPVLEAAAGNLRKPFEGERHAPLRIVSVGRLEAQKRHDITIRAFRKFAKSSPKAELTVYGEGPLRGQLEDIAFGFEKAELPGVTDRILEKLSQADVFVMSSDYEGIPNALLEALALGRVCVSTDCPCGGPAALIEDRKNGFLFPVGDEDALLKILEYIDENRDEASRMAESATGILTLCKPEAIMPQWKDIIDKCLKK